MELSELDQQRVEKLERLRAEGIEPYPRRVERTHTIAEALTALKRAETSKDGPDSEALTQAQKATLPQQAESESEKEDLQVAVVGRLRSMRAMGKVTFAHIEDGSGTIQLFMRLQDMGEEAYEMFKQHFDLGDFVGAEGRVMRTRTGEPSVQVETIQMLSKAISPLPVIKEKEIDGKLVRYTEFSDVEERYRQRYADLASNPEVRKVFRTRARIIQALRRFFEDRGFLEVETPILQPVYGGAAARPFITHHNQLHQDLYLRIAFELYLKRLLVGMYERVYEIGHDFRNEGVSPKHNPEFTQLEFYVAYWDYTKVMEFCEKMIVHVADEVLGTTEIHYQGHKVDLSPPWRRVTLRQAALEATGIDYMEHRTAKELAAALQAKGLGAKPDAAWGYLIDKVLLGAVEPTLIQPTFVLDYPRDISPFAKTKPDDPTHVERFEFFIAGLEMGNAFTELNDPLDQEQRFLEAGRLYAPDDEEAHPMDEDYLRAMKYGMPPNGGFGMGVDRLTMLLTDKSTIREVILYPHLRSRE